MRIVCILTPYLPVQVEWQHDPSLTQAALVVGGRPWDEGAVFDCCPQAAVAGVTSGMRLAQAEKLCPTARFVPARDELYQAAHDALFAAARYFTPTVETAGLGFLYAEVSGLERRFGPETRLTRELLKEAIQTTGLDVRVGVGSGKFVARQAARAAMPRDVCVVPPGEERRFLSPLPLSVLPTDHEMARRLQLLGVHSLGALAKLPRPAIVNQFGVHAGPLYDLAQGVDPRPVRADAPPLQLARLQEFDEPLNDRAPLLAHAARMAGELSEALSGRGYQAEGIRVRWEGEGGEARALGAPVKPPSSGSGLLSRLAARLLEELAPVGPVISLSLIVYPLRPFHLGATQMALFGSRRSKRRERLREVLRRLRERFGELIVVVASLVGPPPPRPIQVTTAPDGLPRALVWRDRIREVATVYETWRERRRWWSWPVERDYFRLETRDGQVRIIFRDRRKDRWLLERRHI